MTEEYEEPDYDANETNAEVTLPAGVVERLTKYAERTKRPYDEVLAEWRAYVAKEFSCDHPEDEDEDLLVDWTEMMLVETRAASGGGAMAGTVNYVGWFLGADPKRYDRRSNLVRRAKRDFTLDPNKAVGDGFVGHYIKRGATWALVTNKGEQSTSMPSDEVPEHSFVADGERICLLAKSGKPKAMSMMGRNFYFLGAEEGKFTEDGAIQQWRLDCQGEDADMEIQVGVPCRVPARPPNENVAKDWADMLSTGLGVHKSITYTDDFVSEDDRPALHPFRAWTDMELHDAFAPLEDLVEVFESRSRTFTINGEQGKQGPVVITRGTVNRLSSEPRDNQYDEDGRGYSIALTSMALQSEHGRGDSSEVMGWMGSACNDLTNPFIARDGEEEIPYAERSTVLVVGRIAVKRKDGADIPNLKVMGVFADPRRIRRRQTGGDTGQGQFN